MNTFFNRVFCFQSISFLLVFSSLHAQSEVEIEPLPSKHELRLDIFQLVVLPGIEITYERFIDDYSSWGVNGFVNFDFDDSQAYRYENFELSPYYRFYFSKKNIRNAGFFVQPFMSLTQGEYPTYRNYYFDDIIDGSGNVDRNFFGLAAGALIGKKWINLKNYTFEITAGVGRLLTKEEQNGDFIDSTAYPRINFAIGKRF